MQKDACGAMLLFQVVVQSLHLKAIWGTHLSAPPAVGKGSLRAFCVRNWKRVQEVCSSTACVSCGGATNILHLVDENNKTPWLHQVLRAAFVSWAVLAWVLLVFSCTNCTMFVQGEWGAPVWCAWPRSVLWFPCAGVGLVHTALFLPEVVVCCVRAVAKGGRLELPKDTQAVQCPSDPWLNQRCPYITPTFKIVKLQHV